MLKEVANMDLQELDSQFHGIVERIVSETDALEILELSGGFAASNTDESKRGSSNYFMSIATNGEKVFGASHIEVMKRAFVISKLGSKIEVAQ